MIQQLPDPEVSDVDPLDLYVAGYRREAEEAVANCEEANTDENRVAAAQAGRRYYRVMLDVYGEKCGTCEGNGEVEVGTVPASQTTPAEWRMGQCQECHGEGVIIPNRYLNGGD